MTEREALEQKSFSDLLEIAVAFNLISREEASSKTASALVALIARDDTVDESPKKKNTKRTSVKKTDEKSGVSETAVADVVVEANQEPTVAKKTRSSRKTTRSKSLSKEEQIQAEAIDVSSEVVEVTDNTVNEVTEEVAVEVATDEKKVTSKVAKSKRTSKSSKNSKSTRSKESSSEDVSAVKDENSDTEQDSKAVAEEENKEEINDDNSSKKKSRNKRRQAKKTQEEATLEDSSSKDAESQIDSVETAQSDETKAKTIEKASRKRNGRDRKRSFSFGKQNGEVVLEQIETGEDVPSEASGEETVPEVVEPEIQYIEVEGVLSIGSGDKGDFNGFVHRTNYLPGDEDAFVQGQLIRRLGLRKGDYIKGLAIPPRGKEKYSPLRRVLSVNGIELTEDTDLDVLRKRKRFESLTAIYPDEKLKLETTFGDSKVSDISTRIIDLFSPIGKGQRGMIVSPPKAGKTVLLKKVANAITANNPNCKLIVLLIDERPEEVTDMQRSINGEVVYSTFDKKPENHVRVTELVLERAMRLVELGEDVVILLDSMTRLARAYNLTINPTGRTLSGGLDPGSLYGPKRFFGAARNIENGGSLTIIATALIETGSRMDEVIFEEFKGTGNMEVTLDRKLADRRVFPAIAVDKSGTRREDLLLTPEELEAIWLLRKRIADVDTTAATDAVINFMQKTTNNNSFVLSIKKSFAVEG